MTNTTTATSYPFLSRAQITTRIAEDDVFMLECLQVMYCRQTQHEQDTKSTLNRNRAGFMSSHAVCGSTLAVKARNEVLSEDELSKARSIVCRYGKQLASHFRQVAITENPALKAVATLFSAG